MFRLDLGPNGERVDETLEQLRALSALGVTQAHGGPSGPVTVEALELIGERIIPEAAKF